MAGSLVASQRRSLAHLISAELSVIWRFVDWASIRWEEGELSRVALPYLGVPDAFRRQWKSSPAHM
jgi:hypothetical protein